MKVEGSAESALFRPAVGQRNKLGIDLFHVDSVSALYGACTYILLLWDYLPKIL